jgi:hypothetical protein
MSELKDWRGHVITVGTPVAYPVKAGHAPGIKSGVVTDVGHDERGDFIRIIPGNSAGARNWTDRPRTLREPTVSKVVVLPRTNHEPSHG